MAGNYEIKNITAGQITLGGNTINAGETLEILANDLVATFDGFAEVRTSIYNAESVVIHPDTTQLSQADSLTTIAKLHNYEVEDASIEAIELQDHDKLVNKQSDGHLIYPLLAGRTGGQTLIGGDGAGENLTLQSTSNVSKGSVIVDDTLSLNSNNITNVGDIGTSGTRISTLYATSLNASSDATVGGNLVVTGDLTVNGTTTTINTATVEVEDNVILLNKGEVGAGVTAGTAGIEIERGSSTNYQIIFDESDDTLKAGLIGSLTPIMKFPFTGTSLVLDESASAYAVLRTVSNDDAIYIYTGGTNSAANTAYIAIFGNAHATNAGKLKLGAGTGHDVIIESGDLDLNTNNILNAGSVTATSFSGDGSALTGISVSLPITGTSLVIEDAALYGIIRTDSNADALYMYTGATNSSASTAYIAIFGNTHATNAGKLKLGAGTGQDVIIESGDLDLGTNNILNAGSVTATSFSGDGSALTGISTPITGTSFVIEDDSLSATIRTTATDDALYLYTGSNKSAGNTAYIELFGNTHATNAGRLAMSGGAGNSVFILSTLNLNSNNITSVGTINASGTITASSFSGDGSSLTGLPTPIDYFATLVTYAVGDIVMFRNMLFVCTSGFTSDPTTADLAFAASLDKWNPVDENIQIINQAAHGFSQFDAVYESSGTWASALASTDSNLATHFIIMVNTNYFLIVTEGTFTFTTHGLGTGILYANNGSLSNTPTTYANPVLSIIDANNFDVVVHQPVYHYSSIESRDFSAGYELISRWQHSGAATSIDTSATWTADTYSDLFFRISTRSSDTTNHNWVLLQMITASGRDNAANYEAIREFWNPNGASTVFRSGDRQTANNGFTTVSNDSNTATYHEDAQSTSFGYINIDNSGDFRSAIIDTNDFSYGTNYGITTRQFWNNSADDVIGIYVRSTGGNNTDTLNSTLTYYDIAIYGRRK